MNASIPPLGQSSCTIEFCHFVPIWSQWWNFCILLHCSHFAFSIHPSKQSLLRLLNENISGISVNNSTPSHNCSIWSQNMWHLPVHYQSCLPLMQIQQDIYVDQSMRPHQSDFPGGLCDWYQSLPHKHMTLQTQISKARERARGLERSAVPPAQLTN